MGCQYCYWNKLFENATLAGVEWNLDYQNADHDEFAGEGSI